MDAATQKLAEYIKGKGIAISAISKGTHIPYGVLNPSISKARALRADEFLLICRFLEVDPMRFHQQGSA